MKILKSGKEEIVILLNKVIEKYKNVTGQEIVLNTNRKNYEAIAILLSNITNEFPSRWQELGTEAYTEDTNKNSVDYPYRKYDVTGGQVKDALNGIVSNPRNFLVDACYIYLYGIGRKAFEKNPVDESLLKNTNSTNPSSLTSLNESKYEIAEDDKTALLDFKLNIYKKLKFAGSITAIVLIVLMILLFNFYNSQQKWQALKTEMNIIPYKPNKAEIDSLEGVWLCYTGSPQARISDPKRYHKVVRNLIKIDYKDGFFSYNRYGASFNHLGYMQFESPGIVSVFSKIKNSNGSNESPRHSLLNLYANKNYLAAISASWNFDVGEKNKIIGIREIYIKLGKGGEVTEILNDVENASCNCKVMKWQQSNGNIKKIYLKNELLDSLDLTFIKDLIDEKSILENTPQDKLLVQKDSLIAQSTR